MPSLCLPGLAASAINACSRAEKDIAYKLIEYTLRSLVLSIPFWVSYKGNMGLLPRGSIFASILVGVFVNRIYNKLVVHQQPLNKADFKHVDFTTPEV